MIDDSSESQLRLDFNRPEISTQRWFYPATGRIRAPWRRLERTPHLVSLL